ncbi:Carnosine N-methyltransferase [Aphelenchoides bicaudatus]|nr:Carnosine N-methyltransferase [Aphelenchoides bicaudatus]
MEAKSSSEHDLTEEQLNDEVDAIEKVIDAMLFYEKHASILFRRHLKALKAMSVEDKRILAPILQAHVNKALVCAKANQHFLEQIVNAGSDLFGNSLSFKKAYEKMGGNSLISEHYMSKAQSTLKQIVRDWSKDGEEERRTSYDRCMRAIRARYPNTVGPKQNQHFNSRVCGNEFSFFMILTSNYMLNCCQEVEEFTIYPYLLEFSNVWSYEDALKPVKFPDSVASSSFNKNRPNNFSMCAGDFVGVYGSQSEVFDCVATVFFLDTAKNPIEYMRIIYKILKPGGSWICYGPLTYHFENEDDCSLELPFDEICKIAAQIGFNIECVEGKDVNPSSTYTGNPNSMLKYLYHSGFIECTKPF